MSDIFKTRRSLFPRSSRIKCGTSEYRALGKLVVTPSDTKLTCTFSQSANGTTYRYATTTTKNYGYDNDYQLTTAGRSSYAYDAVGNRTSGSYNNSNELISDGSTTYAYDNNGNLTTKTASGIVSTYSWDFENRLTSIAVTGGATTTFKYDPFGRRIEKNGEVYAYDGANLIETLNTAGIKQSGYTFSKGVDEVLAKADNLYYADGLGSVRMIANKIDSRNSYGRHPHAIVRQANDSRKGGRPELQQSRKV